MVAVVRAGFLEEVGWPEMVGELPAFRAPHSQPPGSSAGPSREAARPLQAAARRRLSPARRVRHWRRRLRGGSPSLYLSSSLALPAAFSRHHAHSSRVFPSGCARPSSLLGSCLQSPPWRRGHLPLLLFPHSRSAAKTIVANMPRAPPTTFPLKKPAPQGTRLAVSREPRRHLTLKHILCAKLCSMRLASTDSFNPHYSALFDPILQLSKLRH